MKSQRVTLKDIAEHLNISVGTVDRAVHGRGRINEETRTLIMKKIEELGYKPNRIARVLGKNEMTRLVFVTPAHNQFWEEVMKGAQAACDEMEDYGLHIDFCSQESDYDTINQVKELSKIIGEKPKGIIVAPLHPYLLSTPINEAVENDIPVITVNLDSKDSRRLCYVGENPYITGSIMATLFGKYMGGSGDIAVLTGSADLSQFQSRKEGFLSGIAEKYPDINIIGMYDFSDNIDIAYEISKKLITDTPGIKGIFANTTVGTVAIGRAIKDLNRIGSMTAISYDISDEILELLDCGALSVTVTQNPFAQGYYAVKLLHKVILEKYKPERELYYTRADIVVNSEQYNLFTTGLYHSSII